MDNNMEKECIILVGSQGSGKTELALTLVKKYQDQGSIRISQDEFGKEHFNKFKGALKEGIPKIVIDRINHTREQRRRYLDLAKQHNYTTNIIDITKTPRVCFDRIINRKNHPTIPHQNKDLALKVLYSYYSNYEKPRKSEADVINYLADFNPNFLDLTKKLKNSKYLIVGDIHGCFQEFVDLLILSKMHKIISVGDLVDKGPKIKQTLMFFMSNKSAYVCMGNHENKFLRYLVGNKVNPKTLKETIKQTKDFDKYTLALYLMAMPKMIKIDDNYIFHAGINPQKGLKRQNPEFLLYARKFNPIDNTFEDRPDSKYWHEYTDTTNKLFFGHNYHKEVNVQKNVFALDGHCVHGKELRGMVMPDMKLFTIKSNKVYAENDNATHNILENFEYEVSKGNVNRSESDNLVLYKYSKSCAANKIWNDTTRRARGIIFDKNTGECIARPYPKFFNVDEVIETEIQNLPKKDYDIFDKLDGSLGISYWQNDEFKIASSGSFDSPQAIEANKILKENGYYEKLITNDTPFIKDLTFLFEIIYPENKIVCDYNQQRDLILTGVIDRFNCHDYDIYGPELEKLIDYIGFKRAKKYSNETIDTILEQKGTLDSNREGWIIRYKNGFRVKVKGDEYLKLHRINSDLTPLFVWENMKNGKLDENFYKNIDEEHKDKILHYVNKLTEKYDKYKEEMLNEIDFIIKKVGLGNINDREYRKKIGIFLQKTKTNYSSLIFPYLLGQTDVINEVIMKKIKPKGNEL